MGDLNASEALPAMGELTAAGWIDAFRAAHPATAGFTVWQRPDAPGPTVFRRVDYVFLAPGRACTGRVLGSRVVLDTPRRAPDGRTLWPSDHYGVLADLDLRDPACARRYSSARR
jgi:exonuclease III